ncbi:hemolysin family protein [Robertmurraya kyonggiensis]|uniref:HlyC/CorC family transporter n=1 Tax=Robertmurraya kyonggiensis TaxID=1037680 RepID=A0A4U1D9L1_9BACI|nr:hemolysin family protein [Robertmurraya kyonggiensis]TKC18116.1 HlyC/CorC family transporter [Robertmurraya kyonggiensis]
MDIFNLVLLAILIAFTAFFVASEFAIIRIRSSRVDQLIEEGSRGAIAAKKIITHLDEYLSACQLGITVTALGIGWLGEPTIAEMLDPLLEDLSIAPALSHVISGVIAFVFITFLHVVVGELAPKTVAIRKAEKVTLFVARALIWFYRLFYPFIWALNGSARVIVGWFGLKPAKESEEAHSEEELRLILSESYKSGEINQSEFKYVNKIFEFDDRIAKEIMVPRTEIVSLSKDDTIKTFIEVMYVEKFTRYPVIDGDKDHIIGLINLKEVMTDLLNHPEIATQSLASYIRPIIRVIDTVPIGDLLIKMQKERIHMAILMDEYGGTSGLVTVEDIIEEIVGEIRDEFDMDEISEVRKISDDHYIFDSKVLVSEVNDLLGLEINDEDVDTIGGWILTENFEVQEGDSIINDSYVFTILEMEEHHIKYLEVTKLEEETVQDIKNIPLTNSSIVS